MIIICILCLFFGVLIGYIVRYIIEQRSIAGILRIDHSDPSEPPYMFLEGLIPMYMIVKKKTIILEVSIKDFIPRD